MFLVKCLNLALIERLGLPCETALKAVKFGRKTIDKTKVIREACFMN